MNWWDWVFQIGGLIAGVGALGYTIMTNRSGARQAELDGLRDEIAEVERKRVEDADAGRGSRERVSERLTAVEQQLQHMPDKDTVHRLELAVTQMGGEVKAQGATMAAISDNVKAATLAAQRIENYMMESRR